MWKSVAEVSKDADQWYICCYETFKWTLLYTMSWKCLQRKNNYYTQIYQRSNVCFVTINYRYCHLFLAKIWTDSSRTCHIKFTIKEIDQKQKNEYWYGIGTWVWPFCFSSGDILQLLWKCYSRHETLLYVDYCSVQRLFLSEMCW